jgi:hypothetical protein
MNTSTVSFPSRRRQVRALVASATLVVGVDASAQLNVIATWATPVSGSWRQAVKWSGGVEPVNGHDFTYSVTIGAAGADYTVVLDSDVTIDDFVLGFPNATLEHTLGTFSVLNSALTLVAGSYRINGGAIAGGSITQNGGALVFTSGGGALIGTSVVGNVIFTEPSSKIEMRSGADFTGNATLSAISSTLVYEYDATIANGRTINLDGAGANLSISRNPLTNVNCTLNIAPGATVRGQGIITSGLLSGGTTNTLLNQGIISADTGGLTIIPSVFVNNGAVQASNGAFLTIAAATFSNGLGNLAAVGGSHLIATNVSGGLNKSLVSGSGGLMQLNGTYTLNESFAVTGHATLFLQGNWTRSATLDASGQVIMDYEGGASPLSTVKGDLISGRNGGAWNGGGINSSGASVTPGTAVGYAEASDVLSISGGTFAGQPVDGSAVLVRWTFEGDANLDGKVDVADLGRLASSWQATGAWSVGDFNYDGTVNVGDLGMLASQWQAGVGAPTPTDSYPWALPDALAALGLPAASVPEPASLSVASMCLGLLRHRRCRR